jgi:glucose-6-phosphate 1-epimerase
MAVQSGATAQTSDEREPLSACIASLRQDLAARRDVKPETFDTYTRDVQDLRPLIDSASRAQPEFQVPIWDYLARRTDALRVAQGRELMQREAAALAGIERRNGVEAATAVAVFGVETDYGRSGGTVPVVDATLSRACLNLKSTERKQHFFAALWLLQEGVVKREEFKGSWAGAFGLTQFLPGTFVRTMADGDGPPADIIHSVPDALATTARYLRSLGWTDGIAWGVEVQVPESLAPFNALEGDHACLGDAKSSERCRTVARWSLDGVKRVDGTPLVRSEPGTGRLAADTPAALLMPAGPAGPAWLVTSNYQAIWRYNRADAYGLAIGLLSDALRGGPLQKVAWPTDDPGLSRAEFREVQALLLARGHCDMKVDGADGPRTRDAVRQEEARLGWAETGRAGAKLLKALRAERAPAVACSAAAPAASSGGVFTTSRPAPGAALPPTAPAAPPVPVTPPTPVALPASAPARAAASAASAGSPVPPHETSPASAPAFGVPPLATPPLATPPVVPPAARASQPS